MRIAIVNDLPMAVEMMRRVIVSSSKHEVAWIARDGAEAVAQCLADRPDLVLMDLIMPGMDGVEATRCIMATSPCAILVVTATVEGNSGKVFEAMGAGALDVVQTPALGGTVPTGAAAFLYKIDATARLIGEATGTNGAVSRPQEHARQLVAIGASAGGPAALAKVLSGLPSPSEFPAAIVIVQHVDAHFAPGLATWLNGISRMPVRIARDGDIVEEGVIFLAGTNDHLTLQPGGILIHTPQPASCAYRPSVNVLFESILRHWRHGALGALLTGMGRDGATGLKLLRDAGHHTIGQDRATSAVYGMPKAAAELGALVEQLPLDKIAESITRHIRSNPTPTSLKL